MERVGEPLRRASFTHDDPFHIPSSVLHELETLQAFASRYNEARRSKSGPFLIHENHCSSR